MPAGSGVSYKTARKRASKAQDAPVPAEGGNGARPDISIEDELWAAAVRLRGNVAPADYKHYVLPLLFLRYISLRYEQRHAELDGAIHDPKSEYFTEDPKQAKAILVIR